MDGRIQKKMRKMRNKKTWSLKVWGSEAHIDKSIKLATSNTH